MDMKLGKFMMITLSVVMVSCGDSGVGGDQGQQYDLLEIAGSDAQLGSSYSASIRGRGDIKIIPRVDGYLTQVAVSEGAKVRQGQTLFVIDQVPYLAALQSARASVAVCEAGVATAELTFESKRSLREKEIVSDYELTSAKNALSTARAQLDQAKAQAVSAQNNLSYTVIKSPSDGVVGKLPYRKGDYVSAGIQDGLTVVADNGQMYVYFSMSERQVMDLMMEHKTMEAAIEAMPPVQLRLSNGAIYEQKGAVESISGVVDASTGAVSVRAAFPNADGRLLSGGAGSVEMPYIKKGVIVIPQEATFEIQDKTFVYRVLDSVAVSTIVKVDKINDGQQYIVNEGLSVGDVIIARGAGLVQQGTKVKNGKKK